MGKQILPFWIIFGLSSCGPEPDDVHVHLNMSKTQKVGEHRMKTSPESDFPGESGRKEMKIGRVDSNGNIIIGGSHGDIFSAIRCGEYCSCNKWECRQAAHREWHENLEEWWNPVGMCKKIIGMNKRECNIVYNKNTNCNRRGSCNKTKVGKTSSVEECRNICKKREQCKHYIWHKQSTMWSRECMLVEEDKWGEVMDVYKNIDSNTITGTCKRVSNCIEANIYYHGNDIDRLQYILSAQDCACKCKNNLRCKFFSWVESQKLCLLKTAIEGDSQAWIGGDGSINVRGNNIHGFGNTNIGQRSIGGESIIFGPQIWNNDFGGNTHTSARGRTPKSGVYSGSRDCCKEHDDNCPEKNKNYGNGHGLQIRWNVQSWEACSDLCSRRSDCQYWTWHHDRAGKYSYLCKTMAMREYEREDRNCVSGTRACKGASHGQCELDRNTAYFTAYDNVTQPDRQRSLSECIKSCKSKRYCKFFSYHHATGKCYYKTRKSGSKGYRQGRRCEEEICQTILGFQYSELR